MVAEVYTALVVLLFLEAELLAHSYFRPISPPTQLLAVANTLLEVLVELWV